MLIPKHHEIISDKFVSIKTNLNVYGTRLSLFIAKEIKKAHGGTITALSDGVGRGASFIITLQRIL